MSQLPAYVTLTSFFKKMQKENGVVESTNMIQNKWNMRDVLNDIENVKHVEVLIRFYFDTSESKTFADFFNKYDQYYDSMMTLHRDRQHRKHLHSKTVKG